MLVDLNLSFTGNTLHCKKKTDEVRKKRDKIIILLAAEGNTPESEL